MTNNNWNAESLTDIEIAIHFLRLFDDARIYGRTSVCGLAENAVKNMTNPYAKKMLVEKMTEH